VKHNQDKPNDTAKKKPGTMLNGPKSVFGEEEEGRSVCVSGAHDAQVGAVGVLVVIGAAVELGALVVIGAAVELGALVVIGAAVELGALVVIGAAVVAGAAVVTGAAVELGALVVIGAAVELGAQAK
jgi:UDP-3-O-[3-hydroxymyristoyl] glucosamine N-acyltransferase